MSDLSDAELVSHCHPFYAPPDLTGWLRETLKKSDLERMFGLGN